jgi:hypothetical protein
MNKKQVAAYFKASERSVERWTTNGLQLGNGETLKLPCTYEKAERGGSRAVYADADVHHFKEVMERDRATPRAAPPAIRSEPQTAMALRNAEIMRDLIASVAEIIERPAAAPQVSLTDKMALDIDEAAALSGLSKAFLRRESRMGRLKTIPGGRGFLVRQLDLMAFVDNLKPKEKRQPAEVVSAAGA